MFIPGRHIDAISTKYIVAGETSDGAVMFVPAEAVFAEIHAHHAEVVEFANARLKFAHRDQREQRRRFVAAHTIAASTVSRATVSRRMVWPSTPAL